MMENLHLPRWVMYMIISYVMVERVTGGNGNLIIITGDVDEGS